MVGNLAAAIHLYHRDVTGKQHMLSFAGLALGEHRRVLKQPDFISGIFVASIGETLHGMPDRLVSDLTKLTETQCQGVERRSRCIAHYNTMCTRPVARRSL